MSRYSCKKIAPLYIEVSVRPARLRPGGLDFLRYRSSLDCDLLQEQLIQNLWNLLETNKISMEYGARAQFIPEKLTIRM